LVIRIFCYYLSIKQILLKLRKVNTKMKKLLIIFSSAVIVLAVLFSLSNIVSAAQISPVTNFKVISADKLNYIVWTNPNTTEYAGTMIVRSNATISFVPQNGHVYKSKDIVSPNVEVIYYSTGTFYQDSSLTNGNDYYYKAYAVNYDVEYSVGSVEIKSIPNDDSTPPIKPQDPIGTSFEDHINLAWDQSSYDVKQYIVKFTSTSETVIKTTNGTSLDVYDLKKDIKYNCTVLAEDYSGNQSEVSSVTVVGIGLFLDTIPPATIMDLTADYVNSKVVLFWTPVTTNDLAYYNVYQDYSLDDSVISDTFRSNISKYEIFNPEDEATYTFQVTAIDRSGNESDKSNIAKITVDTNPNAGDGNNTGNDTGDGQNNNDDVVIDPNSPESLYLDSNLIIKTAQDILTLDMDLNGSIVGLNVYVDDKLLRSVSPITSFPVSLLNIGNNKDLNLKVRAIDGNKKEIGEIATTINLPSSHSTFETVDEDSLNSLLDSLKVSLDSNGKPTISWDSQLMTDSNIAGFQISRKEGNSTLAPIDQDYLLRQSPFVDTDTMSDKIYSYKIVPIDYSGQENTGSNEDNGDNGDTGNADTKNGGNKLLTFIITSKDKLNAGYFKDVPPNHAFFKFVEKLRTKGIVQGYGGNLYLPYKAITRVEALKIILSSGKVDIVENTTFHQYKDLDDDNWYFDYIQSGTKNGIVKGYTDGYFRPNANVSRIEFLKMVMEVSNINIQNNLSNPFPDLKDSFWGTAYVKTAYDRELIQGNADGKFYPDREISRAEAAKIVGFLF